MMVMVMVVVVVVVTRGCTVTYDICSCTVRDNKYTYVI